MKTIVQPLLLVVVLWGSAQAQDPSPSPSPTPSATPTPKPIPKPPPRPSPKPTASPAVTPPPSPTPKPSPKPTASPSPTATPAPAPTPAPIPVPEPVSSRPSSSRSTFADFNRLEMGLLGGMVLYSGNFESDPQACGSLAARAPLPWVSRGLLGLSEDKFGLFLGAGFTSVDRDFEVIEEPDGSVMFFSGGLDYTLMNGDAFRLMGKVGFQYDSFGSVSELDSGFAFLAGASASIQISDGISFGYTPEFALGAGDWLMFNQVGVGIDF